MSLKSGSLIELKPDSEAPPPGIRSATNVSCKVQAERRKREEEAQREPEDWKQETGEHHRQKLELQVQAERRKREEEAQRE